jgi:hypothetical protein
MELSRLYEINGIYDRHEQTTWLQRKLLLAFFMPLAIPSIAESVKRCASGAGSISDVRLADSAGESLKFELLNKLSRLFANKSGTGIRICFRLLCRST